MEVNLPLSSLSTLHTLYGILQKLQKNRATLWIVVCVVCVLAYYIPRKRVHDTVSSSLLQLPIDSAVRNAPGPFAETEAPQKFIQEEDRKSVTLKSFVELLETDSSLCSECCQCAIDALVHMASNSAEGDYHISQLALTDSKSILTGKLSAASKFKVAKRLRRMGLDIIIEECIHSSLENTEPRALYVPSTPFRFPFAYVSQKWLNWQPIDSYIQS